MRRTFGIIFAVVLMVIMAGNLFAQEMMVKKTAKEEKKADAGAKKMMGGSMMCPMCKQKMGGQGMMGGGMMSMMQGMMGGMGMMDAKPHIAGMAEALKLSEEQQAKLNDLHTAYKKDMIRKRADKEIAEIDLQELIGQDEPDLDAIEGQIREIANLEAATKFAWVKLLVDSKSLLSAEQKAEFKKLMKGKKKPMMKQMKAGAKKDKPVKDKPKTEAGGHAED